MRDWSQLGKIFHGEFSSANASGLSETNSRFTLYTANGVAITNIVGQQVVITDVEIINSGAAAIQVQVFDGANTGPAVAGNKITSGVYAANGGERGSLASPHFCVPGTWPKVYTNTTGQIDGVIHGVITSTGQ